MILFCHFNVVVRKDCTELKWTFHPKRTHGCFGREVDLCRAPGNRNKSGSIF